MTVDGANRLPIEALADEFARRCRRGESPSIDAYAESFPDLAEEIRALFPAVALLEECGLGPKEAARFPGQLGEFGLLREIGRGGMGVVYEAEQSSLGRRVALKVLPPDAARSATQLLRFRREATAAARLHHTNIVPVFGFAEVDGIHFYTMQFISGKPLSQLLRQRAESHGNANQLDTSRGNSGTDSGIHADAIGATPRVSVSSESLPSGPALFEFVARVGVQIGEALAHAHGQGVLHRDIKPGNLLLDAEQTVWITDFGLAKATGLEDLTTTGDLVGTLRYLAPERLHGQIDARGDVYGLGLTLYELATGRPAFDAGDRVALMQQVKDATPPSPRSLNPHIPRDLETIILKSLDRDPARRYQTAAALAEDCRRFLEDRPVSARRIGPVERLWRWSRRNPVVAGAVSFAVSALVIALIVTGVYSYRLHKAVKRADTNALAEKKERERAVANLNKAHLAVNRFLTDTGWAELRHLPHMDATRRKLLEDALAFYEQFLAETPDDPKLASAVGLAHVRLGSIRTLLGNQSDGDADLRLGIAMLSRLVEDSPHELSYRWSLCSAQLQHSFALARAGRDREFEAAAREAVRLGEGLVADSPATRDFGVTLGNAYYHLGCCLRDTGRLDEAEAAFRKAVAVQEPLAASANGLPTIEQYGLAMTSVGLGETFAYQQRANEAEAAFRRGIDLLRPLPTHFPGDVRIRFGLACAINDLGRLLKMMEKRPHAAESLREAAAMLKRLVADHPQVPEYRRSLAMADVNLGSALLQGADAVKAYEEAITLIEELAQSDPTNPDYPHMLGGALSNLAALRINEGDAEKGKSLLERAIASQRTALERRPGFPAYVEFLRKHFYALTRAHLKLRDYGAAAAVADEMAALRTDPMDAYLAAETHAHSSRMADADEKLPPERRRDIAAKYADRSIDLLRLAMERGFRNADQLRMDNAFRSLRSRADFQQLLTDMSKPPK